MDSWLTVWKLKRPFSREICLLHVYLFLNVFIYLFLVCFSECSIVILKLFPYQLNSETLTGLQKCWCRCVPTSFMPPDAVLLRLLIIVCFYPLLLWENKTKKKPQTGRRCRICSCAVCSVRKCSPAVLNLLGWRRFRMTFQDPKGSVCVYIYLSLYLKYFWKRLKLESFQCESLNIGITVIAFSSSWPFDFDYRALFPTSV